MNPKITTLEQEILQAFEDVSSPSDGFIQHECEDCRAMRDSFINQDWKTIDPKLIKTYYGNLLLLSPEAFHYFLPAYLIYSIKHLADRDAVLDLTVNAITPRKRPKSLFRLWRKRFADFTDEQMIVIELFLDTVKERSNRPYRHGH